MWVGHKTQSRHQACQKKTKACTVSKTKTYTMQKIKISQHVMCVELTSDSVSSFFSCRLSPWRELSYQCSQCEWFQSRTPLLTTCEKRDIIYNLRQKIRFGHQTNSQQTLVKRETSCITCLFSSQVDEEGSGRPARWLFFQISNTTLFHLHWLHLIRVEVKDQCTVKPKTG